jgi:menaquinone-dependent protoporphyrinogen oxidase
MDNQVLVAYATKYGATAEIAEKIGEALRQVGLHTDVLPVKRIKDLAPYHAVVLGSAVYIGQWLKEAAKFLQTHETALAQRQVWLFSSGPTGHGNPVELLKGWRLPVSLQPIVDRIRPHDIAVFHGDVNLYKINFIEKAMIKTVNALPGDFRDWEAITSWAATIAVVLKESATV